MLHVYLSKVSKRAEHKTFQTMSNRLILSLSLLLCTMTSFAQRSVLTANTTGYGQLLEIIGDKAHDIDSLIVTGPIDATDFRTIWECAFHGKLQGLNLAGAQVKDNKIPERAFFDEDEQFHKPGYAIYLDLRNITLPEGITEIGDFAFDRVGLDHINIPKSLRKLGVGTFYNCHWLQEESLMLPEGIEEIPANCFYRCQGIKKFVLPGTLKTIGEFAFADTQMSECNFPDGLAAIKQSAFEGSSQLSEVVLPSSCLQLEPYAFSSCENLRKFHFPENITSIPASFLKNNQALTFVEIPSKVTEIGPEAFYTNQNLKEVILHEGLEVIRKDAFNSCIIEKIVLPSTVKLLEEGSLFCNIRTLSSLATTPPECTGKVGTDKKGPFLLSCSNTPVYVPKGCVDAYKSAWGWDIFQTFCELDDDPTAIMTYNATPSAKVSGSNGGIHLSAIGSPVNYKVYTSDGKLFKSGTAIGESKICCPNGLYIVSVCDRAYKVVVR